MNLAVKMQFGSHVYGTNLPTSDLDYKAIYIPTAEDILLQKVKGTIVNSTKQDKNSRNTQNDVDLEVFSLQQYLKLLMEGQTVSVDILFTPEKFYVGNVHPVWKTILENKHRFLHSGYTAFAGYCRQQANKYGIKGSRISALRQTLEWLNCFADYKKLFEIGSDQIYRHTCEIEHASIVEINGPNGKPELHLEVCNRKVPFHATVKYTKSIFQRIFDEYGARALQAEKHEGIDWKALMHAVRIINQSKELLSSGEVIFPRPEKDLLLQIRKGELPYKDVANIIEVGLEEMEKWSLKSTLPKKPDYDFADQIVLQSYKEVIRE